MSQTTSEGASKLVTAGTAFLQHRRFINALQGLPDQERRTRLADYQDGLTGASRVGLQAMLAATAKPETPDAGFLHSVVGRARMALEARAAGGSAATEASATTAADPEALFERDRLLVLEWLPLSSEARRRAVIEHVGNLSPARHQTFVTHVHTMLENTQDQIAHHKANEDQAWGGYIEDRINYRMARLTTGGHDPAWEQQLRVMVTAAERFAEIAAIAGDA